MCLHGRAASHAWSQDTLHVITELQTGMLHAYGDGLAAKAGKVCQQRSKACTHAGGRTLSSKALEDDGEHPVPDCLARAVAHTGCTEIVSASPASLETMATRPWRRCVCAKATAVEVISMSAASGLQGNASIKWLLRRSACATCSAQQRVKAIGSAAECIRWWQAHWGVSAACGQLSDQMTLVLACRWPPQAGLPCQRGQRARQAPSAASPGWQPRRIRTAGLPAVQLHSAHGHERLRPLPPALLIVSLCLGRYHRPCRAVPAGHKNRLDE
jgi:hypothetical protein